MSKVASPELKKVRYSDVWLSAHARGIRRRVGRVTGRSLERGRAQAGRGNDEQRKGASWEGVLGTS